MLLLNIALSIAKMQSLLSMPKENRQIMQWAHDVCTTSRFIHICVWKFCPEHDYVRLTVIPLLMTAMKELLTAKDSSGLDEPQKKQIALYVENDELRLRNIEENYLKCRPSAFVPDNKLSELEAAVG